MDFLWAPNEWQDAQTAHFFIALAVVWGFRAVLRLSPLWGALAITVFASLKEFTFDILVEGDTWQGSCEDFFFYCLGTTVALLCCWVAGRMTKNAKIL